MYIRNEIFAAQVVTFPVLERSYNATNFIYQQLKPNITMKAAFFFLISLFFSMTAFCQTNSHVWNELTSKLQILENDYQKYYLAKDYIQTVPLLKQMIASADNLKLSEPEQKEFEPNIKMIEVNAYYNLACTYSLLNKKQEAINAFGKAIEWGYSEYQHVQTDSDLDNIRKDKKFIGFLSQIKQYDMLNILQQSGNYLEEDKKPLPVFVYQNAEDQNLKALKKYFNLDSIAGNGDEVSKIINLMLYVTKSIEYDGTNSALCEFDAIDFYNYHKATGKGINCRHKAMTLNEMYLAMGFKSRYVTCMPKDQSDPDCHVINCVYSETLKKWLWMDASHGIYVMDNNNRMLGIEEVRERLKNNQPLKLNKETERTKEWYLDYYMAKNLYWIQCTNMSKFNTESRYRNNDKDLQYISLTPSEYDERNPYLKNNVITHNPAYVWQLPGKESASTPKTVAP